MQYEKSQLVAAGAADRAALLHLRAEMAALRAGAAGVPAVPGAVQGSPLGAEISVSTSGSVLDTLRRLKDCKECIRHFWTLRRVV